MDEILLRLLLLISAQLEDLQKFKNYYKDSRAMIDVYTDVLRTVTRLQKDPSIKLTPYNGRFYTKTELDKMFYRKYDKNGKQIQ